MCLEKLYYIVEGSGMNKWWHSFIHRTNSESLPGAGPWAGPWWRIPIILLFTNEESCFGAMCRWENRLSYFAGEVYFPAPWFSVGLLTRFTKRTWWKQLVEFWSLDLKALLLIPLASWKVSVIKKPRLKDHAERPSCPCSGPRCVGEGGHLRPCIKRPATSDCSSPCKPRGAPPTQLTHWNNKCWHKDPKAGKILVHSEYSLDAVALAECNMF